MAATAEEPAIVKWLLIKVRQASVERYATDKPPVSLDSPAVVQAARALTPSAVACIATVRRASIGPNSPKA